MTKFLIPVNHTLRFIAKSKVPHGIPQVHMQYIKHYRDESLVLYRWAGSYRVLNKACSQEIFDYILSFGESSLRHYLCFKICYYVVKSFFQKKIKVSGYTLLSIGSSVLWDSLVKFIKNYNLKVVSMVYDLIPLSHSEYFNKSSSESFRKLIINSIKYSNQLICISTDTYNNLKKFALENNLQLPYTQTILLGGNKFNLQNIARISPQKLTNYFIIVSTIEPRKNHLLLLQIWRRLVEKYKNEAPKLLIVGSRGWRCENVVSILDKSNFIAGNIIEISNCNNDELYYYIKNAIALLCTSFIEGYGLPIMEALSIGTPAIVSDIPVFREIAGEVPEYIDPLDAIKWLDTIIEYAKPMSTLRDRQLNRLANYVPLTWEYHFKAVDTILDLMHEQ